MHVFPFRGRIAATFTPFHDHDSVSFDAFEPMLDRLIELGGAGFCACGSTDQGISLTSDERRASRDRLDLIGHFHWWGIEVGAAS